MLLPQKIFGIQSRGRSVATILGIVVLAPQGGNFGRCTPHKCGTDQKSGGYSSRGKRSYPPGLWSMFLYFLHFYANIIPSLSTWTNSEI